MGLKAISNAVASRILNKTEYYSGYALSSMMCYEIKRDNT